MSKRIGLAVRYISGLPTEVLTKVGNNFSITERIILENWEVVINKVKKIKALVEK